MTISTLKLRIEEDDIEVEHDGFSTIKIFAEPIDFPIEHDPATPARGLNKDKGQMDILQSIDMMEFQANIGMLLRSELREQGVGFPLPKDKYRVEIDVVSSRKASDVPLIGVIKSVIDGINKEIIGNDVLIEEVSIHYSDAGKSSSKSLPKDLLSVRIFSLASNVSTPVVSFADVPVHVVPKIEPWLLDKDIQSFWHIYAEELQVVVSAGLMNDGMQIQSITPQTVSMTFSGNEVSTRDIDNLARAYFPILLKLGVTNNDVHSIHLRKQHIHVQQQSSTCIVIQ